MLLPALTLPVNAIADAATLPTTIPVAANPSFASNQSPLPVHRTNPVRTFTKQDAQAFPIAYKRVMIRSRNLVALFKVKAHI